MFTRKKEKTLKAALGTKNDTITNAIDVTWNLP